MVKGRRVRRLELQDGDQLALAPSSEPGAPRLEFHDPASKRTRRLKRLAAAVIATGLAASGAILVLANVSVPVRGRLATVQGPIAIYDINDQPIASVHSQRHRELDSVGAFSPALIDALLASEDNRFWWHPGIDAVGTLRALITNLSGGKVLEGGAASPSNWPEASIPNKSEKATRCSANGGS